MALAMSRDSSSSQLEAGFGQGLLLYLVCGDQRLLLHNIQCTGQPPHKELPGPNCQSCQGQEILMEEEE